MKFIELDEFVVDAEHILYVEPVREKREITKIKSGFFSFKPKERVEKVIFFFKVYLRDAPNGLIGEYDTREEIEKVRNELVEKLKSL